MAIKESIEIFQSLDKSYIDTSLDAILGTLGNSIKFEDNVWLCDKGNKTVSRNSDYKIYFSGISSQYIDYVKYYVIISQNKLSTKKSEVRYIASFLKYLENNEGLLPLASVNQSTIVRFRRYIDTRGLATATKAKYLHTISAFFWKLEGWDGMPLSNPVNKRVHMYKRKKSDNELKTKYIPDNITKELDKIFLTDEVPPHFKLFYWFCRLYPSRCSEISSLKIDCIKPLENDYVFFKNENKSANDFGESNLLELYIKYEDMGKYLVDLYHEQKKISESLQGSVNEDYKGLLFLYNPKAKNCPKKQKRVCLVVGGIFNIFLKKLVKEKNLAKNLDPSVKITTHAFRHNAITDRLYEGFSTTSIRDLTGHKYDSEVIDSYHYRKKEEIEKLQKISLNDKLSINNDNSNLKKSIEKFSKNSNELNLKSSKVMFRGRLVNLDSDKEERILENKRAYQIAYSDKCIGICTEISSCKSGVFDCFNCDDFAPDSDEIDFFKEQLIFWGKRIEYFELNKNQYQLDHAIRVKRLFETLVLRIKFMNNQMTQEVANGKKIK